MKPKNFPARKLERQLLVGHGYSRCFNEEETERLNQARQVRTKKDRRKL